MTETLTALPHLLVGHYTDLDGGTGCTVILSERAEGFGCAVRVMGQAPGSREHALLAPERLVQRVHGLLLTGGSAFGLAAADGVMRWLEARGRGFPVGDNVVPIVPASVLYDLALGPDRRPGPDEGYAACEAASRAPVSEGTVGAGTGATVAKLLGREYAVKGGLGSAACRLGDGTTVAALVAVNALGDVVDPASGRIVAGARDPGGSGFISTARALRETPGADAPGPLEQTTLAVVGTDAALDRARLALVAGAATAGMARAIDPAFTLFDGDTIYAISSGERTAYNPVAIAGAAAEMLSEAILRAVRAAKGLHGVPAIGELA